MDRKYLLKLAAKNFLFWLSRRIDYPLLPPDTVQVNFSFSCNLRCKMCQMHAQERSLKAQGRQVEIDSGTFRKIIAETRQLGVKSILFIGGEPLLRPDLFDLVADAKKAGLSPVVVTNGVLLGREAIGRCLESGVDWLSISIDAATEETFRRIRGENVLSRIKENIALLEKMKRDAGRPSPRLVCVCTVMDDNLEELSDVVDLCVSLGVERVMFQPVVPNNIDQTQRSGPAPGLLPPARLGVLSDALDKLIAYKRRSRGHYARIANGIWQLDLMKKYFSGKMRPADMPCYAGYNRLQIVQEGRLYFCVNQERFEANFGDVARDSLQRLWFSGKARSYRRLIRRCAAPCLQWCSYRDGFIELKDFFEKRRIFERQEAHVF
ncbi:MAG: radical SAM protein [Candidatus Omnitrophica bacterium]|nr:radical SAM protein [Candidatus Omnitrophota bacterium]MDD5573550.1 radical SAM protein [Candidatus Omnitrophota bacterium]